VDQNVSERYPVQTGGDRVRVRRRRRLLRDADGREFEGLTSDSVPGVDGLCLQCAPTLRRLGPFCRDFDISPGRPLCLLMLSVRTHIHPPSLVAYTATSPMAQSVYARRRFCDSDMLSVINKANANAGDDDDDDGDARSVSPSSIFDPHGSQATSATSVSEHSRASSPTPSVASVTSSIRAQAYREEFGRIVNNYSEVYRLPADDDELDRLGNIPLLLSTS
jgi:hypothetical protein